MLQACAARGTLSHRKRVRGSGRRGTTYPLSVGEDDRTTRLLHLTMPPDEVMARADAITEMARAAFERKMRAEHERRAQLIHAQPGIQRALRAYSELDSGNLETVRIRGEFVRLEPPREARPEPHHYDWPSDVESRPIMTRLVARKQHSLKLLLSMIYVAHLEDQPNASWKNRHPNTPKRGRSTSWLELSGLWVPVDRVMPKYVRAQRRRLTTPIGNLVANGLVGLIGSSGVAGMYNNFELLSETGNGAGYQVPGERQARNKDVIEIPADFFRSGWHLVLTDLEIVTLLALIDRTAELRGASRSRGIHDIGVDLKESVRWSTYGLSGEAYNSVHKLHEFDCIDLIDPMPNRRSAREPLETLAPLAESTADTGPPNPAASPQTAQSDPEPFASPEPVSEPREAYRLIYPPESAETNGHTFSRSAFNIVRDHLFNDELSWFSTSPATQDAHGNAPDRDYRASAWLSGTSCGRALGRHLEEPRRCATMCSS